MVRTSPTASPFSLVTTFKPKCHSETFVISETCEHCLSSDLKKNTSREKLALPEHEKAASSKLLHRIGVQLSVAPQIKRTILKGRFKGCG
jgi:hypothetical protein